MGVSPKRRWEIGETAGLLGVVLEVALRVLIGVVTDDLDGVLVGANGTIGTQAVELAGDRAGGSRVDLLADGQGSSGHIVVDADGEVVLGSFVSQVIKDRLDVWSG